MKRFGPLGWLVQTYRHSDRQTQTLWEPVECREVSRTVETFRPVRMVGTDIQTDRQTQTLWEPVECREVSRTVETFRPVRMVGTDRQTDRQTHTDTVGASRV